MTVVVNLRREPYDVYIGRVRAKPDGDNWHDARGVPRPPKRGCFGNPWQVDFAAVRDMSPEDARRHLDGIMAAYRAYFLAAVTPGGKGYDPEFRAAVLALKGKRLGCFCKPGPCHGDVIVEWLEARP